MKNNLPIFFFIYFYKKTMKKIFFLILSILTFNMSFSQEFLGIKPDGTKQEVINKFILKGFRVKNVVGGNPNVTTLEGNLGGTPYEVNVVNTPTSKKVWKIAVYLPEKTTWYSLKTCFYEFLGTLTEKYGQPEKTYEFFSSPYYEGDGYEMSAVQLEKCNYFAYWKNISIEISKWKQVKISYENEVNSQLNEKENEKINENIF